MSMKKPIERLSSMKILSKLCAWMGSDGMAHVILSALVTIVFNLLLPTWGAIVLASLVGISKELYDKYSNKGCAEIKDLICDLFGILIGIL